MISLPRISRLAAAQRFDALLDDVLANGRHVPLALRLRLGACEASLGAAALALGLQRFLELTLGPTPQSLTLARALLDRQRPDGGFGAIGATAAAIGALRALSDHLDAWPPSVEPSAEARAVSSRVTGAIADALGFLREALASSPSTLLGRPLLGDEHDTLITLWQLADHADIADDLDLPALLASLDDLGVRHDSTLGPFLARADAALSGSTIRRPTLAA